MTLDDIADIIAKDSCMMRNSCSEAHKILVTSSDKVKIKESLNYLIDSIQNQTIKKKAINFRDGYVINILKEK